MWLEHLAAAPAVVVGQSLGGHTAFLLAARRPDLVRALVVVEASPQANPAGRESVSRWLGDWPVPFTTAAEALRFFGGDTAWSRAWVRGLEQKQDGWWPRFDVDVMVGSLAETSTTSYWEDWARISCPTLIVTGERGLDKREANLLTDRAANGRLVEVQGAGHDVHLDRLDAFQECLDNFLTSL